MQQKNPINLFLHLLEETQLITLTTVNDDGRWSCPVYFSFDKKGTVYILSDSNSKHIRNIWTNQKVAITFPTHLDETFQMVGTAEIIEKKDEKKYGSVISYLKKLHQGDTKILDSAVNLEWKLIKIVPTSLFISGNGSEKIEIQFTTLHSSFLN